MNSLATNIRKKETRNSVKAKLKIWPRCVKTTVLKYVLVWSIFYL